MAVIWKFLIPTFFLILSKYFPPKGVNVRFSCTSRYGLGFTIGWQEAKGPFASIRIPQWLSAKLSGRKLMHPKFVSLMS